MYSQKYIGKHASFIFLLNLSTVQRLCSKKPQYMFFFCCLFTDLLHSCCVQPMFTVMTLHLPSSMHAAIQILHQKMNEQMYFLQVGMV